MIKRAHLCVNHHILGVTEGRLSCFKVGVNHGIFLVYHFWNFLIFKRTWVCSSSSSKNKNIFLNLSINSINLKMSNYLSISKMCSSLFSRGNQACARIANAKRTTQSQDAALSAIYIKGTRLTFELAHWPWQPDRFFENNSEIHDICWGIMNTYFLILWILPSGFGWNWCFVLSTICANDRNFCVSTRPLRPFIVLFGTTFEQKHCFPTSSFWGSNYHFLDDLDYLLCNVGVSFWFYLIEIHFF